MVLQTRGLSLYYIYITGQLDIMPKEPVLWSKQQPITGEDISMYLTIDTI